MRLHRFYIDPKQELDRSIWLKDHTLRNQWQKVLRYQVGQEVVLFDGVSEERLYRIAEFAQDAVHLELITEFERKLPEREVYLAFSLLKKDKNEWVLQKATELGVSHFIPIVADRSEKLGFDMERAQKIVIEASEQCGRSDIPAIREPMELPTVISELKDAAKIYVGEQGSGQALEALENQAICVLIGPEGGWSDEEKQLFVSENLAHIGLGGFTLRAETAAVAAAALAHLGQ